MNKVTKRMATIVGIGGFAVITAVGVTFVSVQKAEEDKSSLLVRNIVALAQNEGTPASSCARKMAPNAGEYRYQMFCDSRTDADMIYPCPTAPVYDYYQAGNSDRCTK
jgi:hypothetical protein